MKMTMITVTMGTAGERDGCWNIAYLPSLFVLRWIGQPLGWTFPNHVRLPRTWIFLSTDQFSPQFHVGCYCLRMDPHQHSPPLRLHPCHQRICFLGSHAQQLRGQIYRAV